jgi:hypothetical protein
MKKIAAVVLLSLSTVTNSFAETYECEVNNYRNEISQAFKAKIQHEVKHAAAVTAGIDEKLHTAIKTGLDITLNLPGDPERAATSDAGLGFVSTTDYEGDVSTSSDYILLVLSRNSDNYVYRGLRYNILAAENPNNQNQCSFRFENAVNSPRIAFFKFRAPQKSVFLVPGIVRFDISVNKKSM